MTYEVQQTRWDRIIRRVSGSVGPGSRVSETLSELFPVLDVERVPGELLLLGGTRLGTAGFPVDAAALAFPGAQISNPAGSNAIITITKAMVSSNVDDFILWGTVQALLATALPTAARLRDTREVFPTQPVGVLRIDTALVAPIDSLCEIGVLANTPVVIEDVNGVAILAPGTQFTVGGSIADAKIRNCFFWRERAAEESELQF